MVVLTQKKKKKKNSAKGQLHLHKNKIVSFVKKANLASVIIHITILPEKHLSLKFYNLNGFKKSKID